MIGSDTQVNVLVGGALGNQFDAGKFSSDSNIEVNVLGGSIGGFAEFRGESTLNLAAGSVGSSLYLYSGAQLNMSGGEVFGLLNLQHGSSFVLTGGRVNQLSASYGTTVDVSGGIISHDFAVIGAPATQEVEPAVLNFSDGYIGPSFEARDNSVINMSGGLIHTGFVSRLGSVVNLSGGRIYSYYNLEGELNMAGGSIAWGFDALPGSSLNASGGEFESGLEILDATAHFSGGEVRGGLIARGQSEVRLSGGTFGDSVTLEPGVAATLAGAEFQIDGVPVTGLAGPGSQLTTTLPTGALLSGVLADGTPFAFTTEDGDTLSELRLEAAEPLPATPGVFTASLGDAPLGLRAGQTLNVDDGATSRFNVVAGHGSTLNVLPGGKLRYGGKAIGAEINISGGVVEYGFDAMLGTQVHATGGSVDRIDVFAGSTLVIDGDGRVSGAKVKSGGRLELVGGSLSGLQIAAGAAAEMTGGTLEARWPDLFLGGGELDISGGMFDGPLVTSGGGTLLLRGGEFVVDGQPVSLNEEEPATIEVPAGAVFTGVLADGSPFILSDLLGDAIAPSSVALLPAELPAAQTEPIVVDQIVSLAGLRAGEVMVVVDGGVVTDSFNALPGSSIHVTGAGSVGNDLTLHDADLEVDQGSVGTTTTLQGSSVRVGGTGEVNMATLSQSSLEVSSDGAVGYTYLRDGSHARIAGGQVSIGGRGFPIYVESGSSIEFSGTARTSGIEIDAGSSGVVAGGELLYELDLLAGAELEIVAAEFLLDGTPIAGLEPGESLLWTERQGLLSGTYVDGRAFEFDLSATGNSFRRDYFDPAGLLTLTRVLPGDLNRDGAVDAADLDEWLSQYGAVVDHIGDGADANYDGRVDAADYTLWRDHFTPAVTSSAPEPMAAALMASLAAWGCVCQRRRGVGSARC
ncbi:dockerin type I repeat-containing protein [Posidoniimonas polymericola]|nr:dockerin type I repeat-containing protein [Posidoniimonas polymericola]